MDQAKLAAFREKVRTAKKLNEIFDYFFDEFVEKSDFMEAGKSISTCPPMLESVLGELAKRYVTGKRVERMDLRLIRVGVAKLIHGSCFMNNSMGMVIYLEEDEIGLFSICLPNGTTEMARFSCKPINEKPNYAPSAN